MTTKLWQRGGGFYWNVIMSFLMFCRNEKGFKEVDYLRQFSEDFSDDSSPAFFPKLSKSRCALDGIHVPTYSRNQTIKIRFRQLLRRSHRAPLPPGIKVGPAKIKLGSN